MSELTPDQIKALQAEIEKLKADNAEKDNALETAATLVDEQTKAIEALKGSNPNFKPTVEIGEKTYQINHGIRDEKGDVHNIADIEKNTTLIKSLIKSESSAVSEVIK